ncbi:tartrate dehydrogenase [Nocardioides sp. YIM 152315]|uniref:tartrate dehydrogenase n=1 Tax=Nocardioides sp. YIM 152315 TaxID=3031760 RepID=UPI0023DB7C3E|nr:tartrate dehydrogenase [Nocardioides sp. YIM 152315]MDF1605819.1 tartrate dehydrogenase [Nocardioides sp. YIM 152315]
MKTYRVTVIAGDGIGKEVTPGAMAVVDRVATKTGAFSVDWVEVPWSCEWYVEHGSMMPSDGLDQLRGSDAILLGAVGFPGVPDHISLRGLLIPIRQEFRQYANVRPLQLWSGVEGPLRDKGVGDLDILCVRENAEGEYSGSGGILKTSSGRVATQVSVFTENGIERVVRYAMETARQRRGRLASATKSNALQYSAVLWDEVVDRVAQDYPDVNVTHYHVDALAARFVSAPETLDVVVASNLFGDILTDLGAALQGSLGLAASANLNPERDFPSMFEPVHGSAPDIAGRGIGNPVGAIWSAAMMLEHLGEVEAGGLVMAALRSVVDRGPRTRDMGGDATTDQVVAAVLGAVDNATLGTELLTAGVGDLGEGSSP